MKSNAKRPSEEVQVLWDSLWAKEFALEALWPAVVGRKEDIFYLAARLRETRLFPVWCGAGRVSSSKNKAYPRIVYAMEVTRAAARENHSGIAVCHIRLNKISPERMQKRVWIGQPPFANRGTVVAHTSGAVFVERLAGLHVPSREEKLGHLVPAKNFYEYGYRCFLESEKVKRSVLAELQRYRRELQQ
jgi:hypothetical protein